MNLLSEIKFTEKGKPQNYPNIYKSDRVGTFGTVQHLVIIKPPVKQSDWLTMGPLNYLSCALGVQSVETEWILHKTYFEEKV